MKASQAQFRRATTRCAMTLRACGVLVLATLAGAIVPTSGGAVSDDSSGIRSFRLGSSVQGRPINAIEIGDLDSPNRTLVVGSIHGDETAGMAIADKLLEGPAPTELDLWIVPTLNPDGVAAKSRGNSHGVDLNRNFPWSWQRLHGIYDSGPRALSEPESQIGYRFIMRVRPVVSIWFHQHLDVVDESGGSLAVERNYATLVDLRLARLVRNTGKRSRLGKPRIASLYCVRGRTSRRHTHACAIGHFCKGSDFDFTDP